MARIRSTGRAKPDTLPKDVDLRHLWRQLREAGWSSRRPKGLGTDWTYVKPGASANSAIGVDVFLGEAAVVAHIIESGLLQGDNEEGTARGQEEHKAKEQGEAETAVQDNGEGGEAEDIVRPSQIDTSVQLSQSTVQALFSSPTPSEVELSQGAVHRAFDFTQGGLQSDASEQDVIEGTAQLQRLSGASGADSLDSDAPVAGRLRPRREFKRDVNFVEDNENPSDYEQLSSGESDGGALADNEDDLVEPLVWMTTTIPYQTRMLLKWTRHFWLR